MTRVLVDLLFYSGQKGGMESYVRHLYDQFRDDNLDLVGLASTELAAAGAAWFPGSLLDSGVSGASRASWARGELLTAMASAKRTGANLIHSPANIGPWSGGVPVVLTVHDMLPFRNPEFVPGRYGPLLRTLIRRSAANATRIITISNESRADIIRLLRCPEDQIDLIPLAGGDDVAPSTHPREGQLLLALGNRLPHKNFERLLESLALLPAAFRPRLIVTGGGENDPLRGVVARLGLERSVELTAWVDEREIDDLYARATAVVIPSMFEGFGLPVLEAMSRGCPVICSDLPVLREVAQGNAVYFDPRQPSSIAAAISLTLGDPGRLAELAASGLLRSRSFSWARTAALTVGSFYRAADSRAAK
jgi:glycosyltransferase involved in cell wall biosynthesis